jgi:hypothetical protein
LLVVLAAPLARVAPVAPVVLARTLLVTVGAVAAALVMTPTALATDGARRVMLMA